MHEHCRYLGPYTIQKSLGKGVYKIKNSTTGHEIKKCVNGCRLKKCENDWSCYKLGWFYVSGMTFMCHAWFKIISIFLWIQFGTDSSNNTPNQSASLISSLVIESCAPFSIIFINFVF